MLSRFSRVWLFVTLWTVAWQATLSMARIQEWVPIPSSRGIFPTQELNPCLSCLLHWQAGSLPLSHPGSLSFVKWNIINWWHNFAYNDILWSFFHVIKYTFKTKWNNVCIECWQNVETGWQIHRDTKAKHWRIDASDLLVPAKTLESPLDYKEIKPVNPKGNQPWIFIGRANAFQCWSSNTLAT